MQNRSHPPRILLVLDDRSDRRTREAHLSHAGYSVTTSGDLPAALVLLKSLEPDMVITDTIGDTGMLIRQVRAHSDCLLLVLEMNPHLADRITMLRNGVDDVLPASINPEELDVRCEVLLRRKQTTDDANEESEITTVGLLEVDRHRHELRLDGGVVPATRIEFSLMEQLAVRGEQVTSREYLLEQVWGPHWVGDPHVVDVHLSNLRRKLERVLPGMEVVHTVRGVGFRVSDELLASGTDKDAELSEVTQLGDVVGIDDTAELELQRFSA